MDQWVGARDELQLNIKHICKRR